MNARNPHDNTALPDTSTRLLESLSQEGGAPDAAWARFARLYDPVVRRYLAILRRSWPALSRDWDDDIVQQTFLGLVAAFPARRWERSRGSFRNYLFGVVRNKALSFAARERRLPAPLPEDDALARLVDAAADAEADDAEARTLSAELWRALLENVFASSRIGAKSQAVFQKLVEDGVPVEQLAKEYGMTPNAIYRLRNRIQVKLREKWLAVGDADDLYAVLEKLARDLARGRRGEFGANGGTPPATAP